MRAMLSRCLGVAALVGLAASPLSAEVVRIEVQSRSDLVGGQTFGAAGSFEKIAGKIFLAVDPSLPANRIVADLDKAPRNAAGKVEFSTDFFLIKPKDIARGNGAVLYEVSNRGGKGMLGFFNHATGSADPKTPSDMGDGFLMRQGYTLVWVGWQFDIPRRNGLMALDAAPTLEQGQPVTSRISTIFTPNTADATYPLDDMGRYADTTRYPPVDPTSPANALTVRDGFLGTPRTIPREQWQFGRMKDGVIVPDISALYLKDGYQPGHVYEVSYEAKGAVVAGLGFAALRDMASVVKHQQAGTIAARYAYAYGPSQDGRFLRQFLYEGFNVDESDRRAFDGVIAHIAGSARGGDFNSRFARPNGLGFFVASLFPYLDVDQRDPVTDKTDGVLMKLTAEQRPRIFYTNSSGEYWGGGRAAALTHTTLDGAADASVPDNVRIYLFAGTQHIPGGYLPSQGAGAQKPNGNEYSWAQRALLAAMDRWVREGVEPPASAHPRLSDKTLVPLSQLKFPAVPGMRSPLTIPGGYRADLEGHYNAHPLPMLVPQVDVDGNEVSGIRLPNVAVPLATYTGWTFRSPSIGQPEELLPLTGSFVPFPVTKAARDESADSRVSIEERYGNRALYQELVTAAATKLAQEGYLLNEDVAPVVERALTNWDEVTRGSRLAVQ